MLITSANPYASASAASTGLNPATIRKTDSAFAALFAETTPEEMIQKITEGGVEGMMKWKIDQMRKEAAEQALAARGLSLADVAALPPTERIALENQIMDEVAQKVKHAINEQMKRERHAGQLDTYDPSQLKEGQSVDLLA